MKRALSEFAIEGIKTTIPFHLKLLEHPVFLNGSFDIKFLEENDVNKPYGEQAAGSLNPVCHKTRGML